VGRLEKSLKKAQGVAYPRYLYLGEIMGTLENHTTLARSCQSEDDAYCYTTTNVVVYRLSNGRFELVVSKHYANKDMQGNWVDESFEKRNPPASRFRAKTLSELIALSAASFRENTKAQIRNDVYDAEDALVKDLDL
jgi:hypothetical protein